MSEVRPYLKKLVIAIVLGVMLMASIAGWAWNEYGQRLADAPPLPSGTPPLSSVPATTR